MARKKFKINKGNSNKEETPKVEEVASNEQEEQSTGLSAKRVLIIFKIAYILILGIVFQTNYDKVYDDKISMGGDNIVYYSLGKALAEGKGYVNAHLAGEPVMTGYPPMYPYMISKIIDPEDEPLSNIETVKKFNGLLFFLSMVLLFLTFARVGGNVHIAFAVSVLCLFNAMLLEYSFIAMSEIPFMFFTALCLYFCTKIDFKRVPYKSAYFWATLVALLATYYTRALGLAVFGGIFLSFLLQKKWWYVVGITAGFVLGIMPWQNYVSSNGGSFYIKQLKAKNPYRMEEGNMSGLSDWGGRFIENLERYVGREIPYAVYGEKFTKYMDPKTGDPTPIQNSEMMLGLFVIGLALFGVFKLPKHRWLILGIVLGTMSIVMLWPEVWFGPRFIIPLIPIITFLFVFGLYKLVEFVIQKAAGENLKKVNPLVLQAIIILPVLLYLGSKMTPGVDKLEEAAGHKYHPKYTNYFALAEWAKLNTPEDAIICCRKPAMFSFFSNRQCHMYRKKENRELILENFIEVGVDYVVLDGLGYSSTGLYLQPAINKYRWKFENAKVVGNIKKRDPMNPVNYLFKFNPESGYTGEFNGDKKEGEGKLIYFDKTVYEGTFKNNVREGYGVYTWPNGNVFSGDWKNNVRSGEGKLQIANGDFYKGIWVNDSMRGEYYFESPSRNIKSISIWKDNKVIGSRPLTPADSAKYILGEEVVQDTLVK